MAASSPGHIELERALDSITIGQRHRTDLGDIKALAESIRSEGLLQPITVTPDGALVCGRRRLEALRLLGHRSTNVWVRSNLSDRLSRLLAEQNDNSLHKPPLLDRSRIPVPGTEGRTRRRRRTPASGHEVRC